MARFIDWVMDKKRFIPWVLWGLTLVAIFALLAWAAYLRFAKEYPWAGWTGFDAFTTPDGTYYPAKNLWDLLDLLIIPAAIGLGALWFNRQEKEREQRFAKDQQREDALQNYLDKMTELLLKKRLLSKKDYPDDPVVDVAQTKTITTLRILDLERKNIILQFLRDSKLNTFLLINASLREADLYRCELSQINLNNADLSRAHLSGAHLSGADLREADLSRAIVTDEKLAQAESLKGATMPSGEKHK